MAGNRNLVTRDKTLEYKEIIESTGRFILTPAGVIAQTPGEKGVYVVEDTNDNNFRKALKIVWNAAKSHESAQNEWNLWREIVNGKHKTDHILKIYEPPVKLQRVWGTVMELASESLEQRLNEGPAIDQRVALDWITQAAYGVREIHLIGRSHVDLKPANILLFHYDSGECVVKVSDFASTAQIKHPTSTARGTKGYSAPEKTNLNLGRYIYTPAWDIYSLGVTLFKLMHPNSGDLFDPYMSEENLAKDQKNEKEILEKISQLNVSEHIKKFIFSCVRHDPEKREYKTMDDFLAGLHQSPRVKPSANLQDYHSFLDKYNQLMGVLNDPNLHKGNVNGTCYGTASLETIYRINSLLLDELLALKNAIERQDVSGFPKTTLSDVREKWNHAQNRRKEEAERDNDALDKHIKKYFDRLDPPQKCRQSLDIYQIVFCWGPPIATEQANRGKDYPGKERYTLDEIRKGLYKQSIRPETLKTINDVLKI